jgi:putative Holliday junction resolvase
MTGVPALGIDFGSKRIGIATSESLELATPHSTIRYSGLLDEAIDKLSRLIAELEPDLLVLGVPRGGRKDADVIQQRFEAIAEKLRERSGREVVLWDESHSTVEAASRRRERGKNWKSYREEIDREAAAVILQSFLDERARRLSSPQ